MRLESKKFLYDILQAKLPALLHEVDALLKEE
jgi:hypothetical protein